MLIKLSRLQFCGNVDFNTPLETLLVILKSYGVEIEMDELDNLEYIADMVNTINDDNRPYVDTNNINGNTLQKIARFINPDINWKLSQIYQGLNFICNYIDDPSRLDNVDILNIEIGLPTPNCIKRYDASMLYAMCKRRGLITKFDYTDRYMLTLLQAHQRGKNNINNLRSSLMNQVSSLDVNQMINVLSLCNPETLHNYTNQQSVPTVVSLPTHQQIVIPPPPIPVSILNNRQPVNDDIFASVETTPEYDDNEITYDNLKESCRYYTIRTTMGQQVKVDSKVIAITAAALLYNIDLSKCDEPINEYQMYKKYKRFISDELNKNLNHPEHSVNLRLVFNPLFSASYYGAKNLANLAKYYGYRTSDIRAESYYSLLQTSSLLNHFTTVADENLLINKEDPISMSTIDEEDNKHIIYYGNNSGYQWISMDSLLYIWENMNALRDPWLEHKRYFSKREILRLKWLAKQYNWKQLSKLISRLITIENLQDDQINDMINNFVINSNFWKPILDELYYMGLYMRGWKVIADNEHTIINSSCTIQNNEEDKRNDNSKQQYQLILDMLNECNCKDIFLRLPIFDYVIEQDKLVKVYGVDKGFNLGDRLNIVFNFDNMYNNKGDYEFKDNIYACIRMTSNIVLYSHYHYCKLLGIDTKFKLSDVKQIG